MEHLVLCSGGLKSTFMTSVAIREGRAQLLFIDHGQCNFGSEHRAVQAVANHFNVPLHYEYKRPSNVEGEPLLNIISMLTLAVPIARKLHCKVLYYGLSKDDIERSSELATLERADSFLKSINMLFIAVQTIYDGKGHYLGQVEVEFPLFKLQMHHVVRLGNDFGTPWNLTWTCKYLGSIQCGICSKCLRRRKAFIREGHSTDPAIYKDIVKDNHIKKGVVHVNT